MSFLALWLGSLGGAKLFQNLDGLGKSNCLIAEALKIWGNFLHFQRAGCSEAACGQDLEI